MGNLLPFFIFQYCSEPDQDTAPHNQDQPQKGHFITLFLHSKKTVQGKPHQRSRHCQRESDGGKLMHTQVIQRTEQDRRGNKAQ